MLRRRLATLALSATASSSSAAASSSTAASIARPLLKSSPGAPLASISPSIFSASQHRSLHTTRPLLASPQSESSADPLIPPKRKASKGAKSQRDSEASSGTSKPATSGRPAITTPEEFLRSISTPVRRELADDSTLVKAMGDTWEHMWTKVNGRTLKVAGVGVKDRRYVLWAMEKYRMGLAPEDYKIKPKRKKIVRGWGARVQNGLRVRGITRPGEKRAPTGYLP